MAMNSKQLTSLLRTIDAFKGNTPRQETITETDVYFRPHRFEHAIHFKEAETLPSLPPWTHDDNQMHSFSEPAQLNELAMGTVFLDRNTSRFFQVIHAYSDGSYLCSDLAARIHRFRGEQPVLTPDGPAVRRRLHPPEGVFAFHDFIFGGYVMLDDEKKRPRQTQQ